MNVAADTRVVDELHSVALPSTSWREHSRARVGSWLDRLALRGMCRAFDTTLMPTASELNMIRRSIEPYLTPELRSDPRRFFAFLDDRRPLTATRGGARRAISGGTIECHELLSGYEPFDPEARTASADDWMPIEHWRHDAPAPATVVAVHGFTMGDPVRGATALMAPEWFALGVDVVLVTLPFHGARTPATARYSGELFASWHVGRLNEAVRQSIHDLRHVMTWLRSLSDAPIGMIGMSLGGYLTALMAGLVNDLAFVIPIAAPVRLGTFPSTLYVHSRYAKRMPPPLAVGELDEAYRAHSPLTYPLSLPRERVMLVAGRGDRIVPPEHALSLWRHWGRPGIHWYGGSHVTPFRRAAVFAAGARHLRRLAIVS
jgi:pimeloyl-ACP methyl ester carboxylesterase